MTVTQLVTEILSRCGEGYENWSTRAKAAIKAAIYDLVRSGRYGQADFFGLIHEGDYDPGTFGTGVSFSTLFDSQVDEIISFILIKNIPDDGGAEVEISLASYVEWMAAGYNSELSAGIGVWYLTADEAGRYIKFGDSVPATDDVIHYVVTAWKSALETDGTEVSDYFAGGFISDVAELATARLKKELLA